MLASVYPFLMMLSAILITFFFFCFVIIWFCNGFSFEFICVVFLCCCSSCSSCKILFLLYCCLLFFPASLFPLFPDYDWVFLFEVLSILLKHNTVISFYHYAWIVFVINSKGNRMFYWCYFGREFLRWSCASVTRIVRLLLRWF